EEERKRREVEQARAEEERRRRQAEEARVAAERRRRRATVFLAAAGLLLGSGAAAAALWDQADRAERERRHGLRGRGMAEALKQARQLRGELHAQLAKPGGVFPLLDQPSRWQQQIESAGAALQRARDLEAAAEAPLAVELRQEIGTLASQLQQDKA